MASTDKALADIESACGSGSVIRDPEVLEKYAIDESEAEPQTPLAVVRAQTTQDVSHVLAVASQYEIPVTARGAGTGRVGAAVPSRAGIVLAMEQANQLKGIETADQYAVVGPGMVTGDLHKAVEDMGRFYPPDPNSASSCTIGGNVATNAGGPRTYKYGVTRDYVLGLEVVLADGTILQLGRRTKKGVTGYDLCALITGSEGTLAIVTEATLRLQKKPEHVITLMAMLTNGASVPIALALLANAGVQPCCAELLDEIALDVVRQDSGIDVPANTRAMLILEIDGNQAQVEHEAELAGNLLTQQGALEVFVANDATNRQRLWHARKELSRTLRRKAKYKISEDVVVPLSRLPDLLDECARISQDNNLLMPTYGHAGDGNMHVNFLWNTPDEEARVKPAVEMLFAKTLTLGGTLSGEHGIGLLKKPYLSWEQSEPLIALQQKLKATFDPKSILNPGKIFNPLHGAC